MHRLRKLTLLVLAIPLITGATYLAHRAILERTEPWPGGASARQIMAESWFQASHHDFLVEQTAGMVILMSAIAASLLLLPPGGSRLNRALYGSQLPLAVLIFTQPYLWVIACFAIGGIAVLTFCLYFAIGWSRRSDWLWESAPMVLAVVSFFWSWQYCTKWFGIFGD